MDNTRSDTLSSPNRVGDLMREIKVCLLGVGTMKVLKNRISVVLMVVMFLLF